MESTIAAYLATWNAVDEATRAELLAEHWSPSPLYVDPLAEGIGSKSISATIAAVHEQFPDFVFTQVGSVDSHHRQARFQWGLGPEGAEPLIIGFDVIVTDDEGRIETVLGFLDKVPA